MSLRSKPSIALLATPQSSPSVLYGMYDVLLSVGAVYSDLTTGKPEESLFDVKIVAATDRPFRCFGEVLVEPGASLDDVDKIDVAVVCDIYTPTDTPPRNRYGLEIAWLNRMYAQGSIVAAVCSGSLIPAEAGLLDGMECAGHWGYRDMFREHYPKIRFREESILVFSGEDARLITAGGHSSWHDLTLHLIARLCGKDHALRTAKVYLFSGHLDGQLPFAAMSRRIQKTDAVIGRCQEWIARHYACESPVTSMARHSGLNSRTFARRFLAATGYRPMDYVHALRIEEAKQLIESENISIDEVSLKVGYDDPAFFRRLFKRKAGLTPIAYRRKFTKILEIGKS